MIESAKNVVSASRTPYLPIFCRGNTVKGVPGNMVNSDQDAPNFEFILRIYTVIQVWRSSWCQPISLKPRGSGFTAWSIKIRLFLNNGILAFKLEPYSKCYTRNLVVIFISR